MNNSYLELSYGQVGVAALLIVLCAGASVLLHLGLERKLFIAGVRTVLQLTLIGLILEWVFAVNRWYWVVALSAVMTVIAGSAAIDRAGRRYVGMLQDSLLSIWLSSWLVTLISIFAILRVKPWYQPRYVVPMLGLILGNSLNGISLALDRLSQELVSQRDQVEAQLALGATRWEAARAYCATAVRTGLIPIINSMMVVGIVSIPGMMTGQLLGGVSPVQAVKYQIVVMFLITAASTLGAIGVVGLGYRRLFNPRHQFLVTRIQPRPAAVLGRRRRV